MLVNSFDDNYLKKDTFVNTFHHLILINECAVNEKLIALPVLLNDMLYNSILGCITRYGII